MSKLTASEVLIRDYAKGDTHDADAALKRGSAVYNAITKNGMSVREVATALTDHYGYKISPATIGNYSLSYSSLVQFGFTTGRDANLVMRAISQVQNISGGGPALNTFVKENDTKDWATAQDLIDALTDLKSTVKAAKQETVTRAQQREGQAGDTTPAEDGTGSSSGVKVEDHAPTVTVKDLAQNLSATEVGTFLRAVARRDWTAAERQSIEKALGAVSKAFAKQDEQALTNA